jgi:hypothetical protein
VAQTFDRVGMNNRWMILEHQLPLSSTRLDSMIAGTDQATTHWLEVSILGEVRRPYEEMNDNPVTRARQEVGEMTGCGDEM